MLSVGEVFTVLTETYWPRVESHSWLAGGRPRGLGTYCGLSVIMSSSALRTTSAQEALRLAFVVERVTGRRGAAEIAGGWLDVMTADGRMMGAAEE